jgi:predicted DNA-binding protein (UPF0251 family)
LRYIKRHIEIAKTVQHICSLELSDDDDPDESFELSMPGAIIDGRRTVVCSQIVSVTSMFAGTIEIARIFVRQVREALARPRLSIKGALGTWCQIHERYFTGLRRELNTEELKVVAKNRAFEVQNLKEENTAFRRLAGRTDWPKDAALAEPPKGAKSKRRKRRGRATHTSQELTSKQVEAMKLFGECKGNSSVAAKRMGVSRRTFRGHITVAYKKLGVGAVSHRTTTAKEDRRGQSIITNECDVRRTT